MVRHKDRRTEAEWWAIRPKLALILADADHWCSKKGLELTITCLFRSDIEQWAFYKKGISNFEHSVHEFGRGGDARILYPEEHNQQLVDYINIKYPYDPTRPNLKTVIRHGGTADHLHFQCME